MGAQSIGAILAILVVVIFSVYIIAGGITGLFVSTPEAGEEAPKEETPGVAEIPEGPEAEPQPEELQEPPAQGLEEPQPNLCQGVACPPSNKTCPDKAVAVVSCQNACDPETGECSSCIPDCSGHQATSGGGGGDGGWSPPAGGGSPPANRPPVLNYIDDVEVTEGEEITIMATASDPDNDALTYSIDDDRFTQADNIFTWQTAQGDSDIYTVTITISDGRGGADSQKVKITVFSADAAAKVWLSLSDQHPNLNDSVTVYVKINTTGGVYAAEFKVYFNPAILKAESATEGDFLKQGAQTYPVINISNNGSVSFANTRFNTNTGVSGEGVLAAITFSVIGSGTSQLNLQDVEIVNPGLQPTRVSVSNGTIEIA